MWFDRGFVSNFGWKHSELEHKAQFWLETLWTRAQSGCESVSTFMHLSLVHCNFKIYPWMKVIIHHNHGKCWCCWFLKYYCYYFKFAGIMIYKYFMGLLLTVLHSTLSSTGVISYNKCRGKTYQRSWIKS